MLTKSSSRFHLGDDVPDRLAGKFVPSESTVQLVSGCIEGTQQPVLLSSVRGTGLVLNVAGHVYSV